MQTFRTKQTQEKYDELIAGGYLEGLCRLCEESAHKKIFKYWRIIPNKFPYDAIAKTHDLILPLRHTNGDDLSAEEYEELQVLKRTFINDHYQFIMEACQGIKSIPSHFHLHLITMKDQ